MSTQDRSDINNSNRFEEARKIKAELKAIVKWAQSVDQAPHAYLATIFRKDKTLPIDRAILERIPPELNREGIHKGLWM